MSEILGMIRVKELADRHQLKTRDLCKKLFQSDINLYTPISDMVPLKVCPSIFETIVIKNSAYYISPDDYKLFAGDTLPDSYDLQRSYLKRGLNDLFVDSALDISSLEMPQPNPDEKVNHNRGSHWAKKREAIIEAINIVISQNQSPDSTIWKYRKGKRSYNASEIARIIDDTRFKYPELKDEPLGTGLDAILKIALEVTKK